MTTYISLPYIEPAALDGLFGSPFTSMYSFADGDTARTMKLIDRGLAPWYTLPEIRLRFWRPLHAATVWFDYRLWPNTPALMHLQSVLWFGGAVFIVALLYRRFLGPTVAAGFAALLFTLDDAHALPAAWLANRSSLIALVLGACALILHHQWRESKKFRWAPVAFALFGLSLLAKESAISILGYMFGYALFLDRSSLLHRVRSLAPYVVITVIWRLYYQASGYGVSGSDGYIDPLLSPISFLRAMLTKIPILFAGQFALPPSDFSEFAPPTVKPFFIGWGVLTMVILIPFFLPLLRADRTARFWATGMALSFIPICSTGPMDRLLDFAGIGAMGLLAQFLVAMKYWDTAPNMRLGRSASILYRAMIGIHVLLAPLMFIAMMHLFAAGVGILTKAVDEAVPKTVDVSHKTLVLANAANFPIGFYLNLHRALDEEPIPRATRSLASPSIALMQMQVERISETELLVTTPGGHGPSLFRGEDPLQVGERVELTGVTVTVVTVSGDGWPEQVLFDFEVPLEDPSLLWIELKVTKAQLWTPPPIGETVVLNEFDLGDL